MAREHGEWRPIYQGDEIIDYRCTNCEFGSTFGKGTYNMHFCPWCGADMRGERTEGEWIKMGGFMLGPTYKCSNCGIRVVIEYGKKYKCCPNCEANMRMGD